jgi:hypothetical protein
MVVPVSSTRCRRTAIARQLSLWTWMKLRRSIGHSDRVRRGERPGWRRLCRESGATGRQRHWPVAPVDRSCLELLREVVPGLRGLAPAFEALKGRVDALYIETDALIFIGAISSRSSWTPGLYRVLVSSATLRACWTAFRAVSLCVNKASTSLSCIDTGVNASSM